MNKTLNINGSLIDLSTPLVMGILNVTPDSFYADSRRQSEKEVVARAAEILEEGGNIIDIGAQSTAPNSFFLSAQEEILRLKPALSVIRKAFPNVLLSIDTFYADVAKMAVQEYDVHIINDISGGQIDKKMFETVSQLNVPYILMHMRGTPQTMQQFTDYNIFFQDIIYYFSKKTARLNQLGVSDIIIDPGFGFSKSLEQNYELMRYLAHFDILEAPLLVGISRKSMIYKLLNIDISESLPGTIALNTYALLSGTHILRVHDVKEAVECVKIVSKIKIK